MSTTPQLFKSSQTNRSGKYQWLVFKNRLQKVLTLILLGFVSLLFLMPILWIVTTSFRLPIDSFSLPPDWTPFPLHLENYRDVFEITPYATQVANSFIVTLGIVAGQLVTACLAGYAFARLEFPGKEILFWLILATMMVPLQASIIPVFVLISKLGLSDTLTSLVIPGWPTAFGTFLLRQYFKMVPDELADAALIDGASPFQIFYKIYLPLVKTGAAVLTVLTFNTYWNEYFRPLIFLNSKPKFTVPLAIVDLRGYMGSGSVSVVMAGVVIAMLPALLLYLWGQRYLIEGFIRSGIK